MLTVWYCSAVGVGEQDLLCFYWSNKTVPHAYHLHITVNLTAKLDSWPLHIWLLRTVWKLKPLSSPFGKSSNRYPGLCVWVWQKLILKDNCPINLETFSPVHNAFRSLSLTHLASRHVQEVFKCFKSSTTMFMRKQIKLNRQTVRQCWQVLDLSILKIYYFEPTMIRNAYKYIFYRCISQKQMKGKPWFPCSLKASATEHAFYSSLHFLGHWCCAQPLFLILSVSLSFHLHLVHLFTYPFLDQSYLSFCLILRLIFIPSSILLP